MAFALHHLTAQEQWDWVRRGDATATEFVDHYLDRIERLDGDALLEGRLGAFARVDADRARMRAAARDRDGASALPLDGVVIAEKELADRAGTVGAAGSRLFAGRRVRRSDPIVAAIDESGAISLGATTSPEFGLTGFTEPVGRPPARNPWDTSTGAGGSSGGAAAAVAAGLVPFAVGSDGGGSIRIPAATCGVVGLKPSRGRVPAQGGQDSFAGLVTAGPIARTVADAAMLLDALAGPAAFATVPPSEAHADLDGAFLGVAVRGEGRYRIGVLASSPWDDAADIRLDAGNQAARDRAAAALDDLGHLVAGPVDLPGGAYPRLFRTLWLASTAAIPAHSPAELALLEPYTRELVERGRALPVEQVLAALREAAAFERRTIATFAPWDAILTPSLALSPRPLGWFTERPDADSVFDRQVQAAPYSSFVNVAGLPAITLPIGSGSSAAAAPEGVQLIGRPGGEAVLLAIGRQLERRFGWQHEHPPEFW